jgi:hypothetical protein
MMRWPKKMEKWNSKADKAKHYTETKEKYEPP